MELHIIKFPIVLATSYTWDFSLSHHQHVTLCVVVELHKESAADDEPTLCKDGLPNHWCSIDWFHGSEMDWEAEQGRSPESATDAAEATL